VSGDKSSTTNSDGYPRVVDVECVCVVPMCGKGFSVPIWYNAPDRPVGPPPKMCDDCRRVQDEREESRIRAEEEARRRAEDEKNRKDVLALVEEAGGNPYEFGRYTLNTFPATEGQEKAILAALEWKDAILAARGKYEKVRGLYMFGPTGTAKTQILHCVLRALVEAGMKPGTDVLFDDSMSLIERIQGTYGSDDSTWALLEARINARVWMLDDFMAEKPTDDVIRKLTLILNRREGKPTGVTSNFTPDALRDRHKEAFRLLSRFGTAQFRTVGVQGDDMRFKPEAAA
jgi:DNA replication protein DnaC